MSNFNYPKPKNAFREKLLAEIAANRKRPLPTVDDVTGIWDLGMTGDKHIRQMRDAERGE